MMIAHLACRYGMVLYSTRHRYGLRQLQRLDVLLKTQSERGEITGKLMFEWVPPLPH